MVYAIRYYERMPSTLGLSGTLNVCPAGCKEPPKGTVRLGINTWDARMEAVGNKGTRAQVDFVKPEGQIENHLLV